MVAVAVVTMAAVVKIWVEMVAEGISMGNTLA
jgi:hypothetical protein